MRSDGIGPGPFAVAALGLLTASLTIGTLAVSRERRRLGTVATRFMVQTTDGYRFTELLSPGALKQVTDLVDTAALDTWAPLVASGEGRAFLIANTHGQNHVAFMACVGVYGLDLYGAFGVGNTMLSNIDLQRIALFLAELHAAEKTA